jgi:hypothetical protein
MGTNTSIGEADRFVLLNLSGEEIEKINGKTSIYTNKLRKDQEMQVKKGKGKGDKNNLAKVMIPIPENYLEHMPMEVPNLKIDRVGLPTIGCITILNSHNKMNCADMTTDGGIMACGFKDGSITVWVMDKEMNIDINGNFFCNFFIKFS